MDNITKIKDYIRKKGHNYVSWTRIRSGDNTVFLYVPKEKIAPKIQPGFTSLKQLEFLKKRLIEDFSIKIEIIQSTSNSHQELEDGLYQLLNRKFYRKILSFFISVREESILDSWIEVSGLNKSLQKEIMTHLKKLYKEYSFSVGIVSWLNNSNELPTSSTIIRLVKVNQPILITGLLSMLREEYPTIDEGWLTHRLDSLRKKGHIVRQESGMYALTSLGIGAVPISHSRSSSDIHRALALGRKKCWNL